MDSDQPTPLSHQQKSRDSNAMTAKPAPVEHVASPTSPAQSSSSGRTSFQSQHTHTRTMSSVTSLEPTVRPNRFSTSFPVQPATGASSPTRISHSPEPERHAPAVVPEALASPTGPTDTTFLTAIATQERRVLELKEQLQAAEANLNMLKRQWAQHEANKKRNDARKVTKLQTLQANLATAGVSGNGGGVEDDVDGSSAWLQAEMEKRKLALMGQGRSNSRRVFQGGRHARTLSLLSPARDDLVKVPPPVTQRPLPPRKDSLSSNATPRNLDPLPPRIRPVLISRASTTPDLTTQVAEQSDLSLNLPNNMDVAALDHDALIKTGKKMASTFKDGLWTFWEDLRQATVGEEGTQGEGGSATLHPSAGLRRQSMLQLQQAGKTAKKQSSRASLRPSSRGSAASARSGGEGRKASKSPQACRKHNKSATQGALPDPADPGFWSDHGVAATVKKSPTVRGGHRNPGTTTFSKSASVANLQSPSKNKNKQKEKPEDEPWDTWDDPAPPPTPTLSLSPEASRSSSAASDSNHTAATTVSGSASPRASVEGKKDPIPWPALSKLGPATLRRTASHLMSEWEKSLTPPVASPVEAGKEWRGEGVDYLGLSAEADAMGIGGWTGRRKGD